ncbi:magnesium transporter [Sinorhizobium meliloti]|jgi:magnesium transporter|uniref:Magnesium transporter MgtE n=6 Tax=Rhizobium meliloti TaxID=382 RepID=Q92QC9_RHIME|nr:magnesium transporter [Sinorhizobium meliloti]PST26707.1 magnesium transporter [Mesorhizobium loti]TWA92143.1 magnesium transporter [Ensifer sp. SEMIA 134]TWB25096.1 magnesium transporter [Ensifer sp. SEMIA 135]AEG03959.1 magnesium transporter [Sinorhizobium meliloti BL225C]AEH79429.1 putative transporter transmembrane protein [Sinorhizobium meliloti SM11]
MSSTGDDDRGSDEIAVHDGSDIYAEDGSVRSDFLMHVGAAIADRDTIYLRQHVAGLHASELGDLIEAIQPEQRIALVLLLGKDFDLAALTEVDEGIRLDIVEHLPNEQIAEAIGEMDSDDAVYILEDLDEEDQEEILAKLPFTERVRLRRSLDYPESTAGRRMQTEFVAVPPFWTVGQTIDYMREDDDLPESFTQIFVIDPTFKLLGAVDLDRVLRAKRSVKIDAIMRDTSHSVPAEMDQEEAAQLFEQYDLLSAAVVDENGRLVGVLTIDDVVDVIQEEAEEDFLRLSGVGDEELSDSVAEAARSRVPWLFINSMTACVSASVIGLFDATIQQIVALAVLMPIVAGMGGNAGSQTMTVTVRALATRGLDIHNAPRIIRREAGVGLLNGVIFGGFIGLVAGLWFQNPDLGGIIATAMLINMMAAALAGILIPILLERYGADPAVSSAVFVTTVTDITGFFSFLGIATWWFSIS